MFDFFGVDFDLVGKFVAIIEKSERMIIGFADDFDAAGGDKTTDLVDEGGIPHGGLFEPSAGDAEAEFEAGLGI